MPREGESRSLVATTWLFAVVMLVGGETAVAQVILPPGLGAARGGTVPSDRYDLVFMALAEGDVSRALEIAVDEYRGGMRAGTQRWIDSIASAMAVGECHWELGQFREAVAAFDEAMLLASLHSNWMLAVQFPPQGIRPLPRSAAAPWGPGTRNAVPAMLPATMSIRMEGTDPQQVLQRGGVLAGTSNHSIRPQEIVRGIVVSLYRRADILGELSSEAGLLDQLTRSLAARPAPPNHYSQAWVDLALGTALYAQGKLDQATPLLQNGLLLSKQFDHPMTAWGLIVLGRIALAKNDLPGAVKCFEEASLSAHDYGDLRALEEAFRWSFASQMAAGTRGVPRSVATAADWARGVSPSLRARLLAMKAEALAVDGNAAAATATVGEIDPRLLHGDVGRTLTGAHAAYALAVASSGSAEVAKADQELRRAVEITRNLSPRLFQIRRLVESVLSGGTNYSDRQADAIFSQLLSDPPPREQAVDPLGAIVALCTPRPEAFEAWIAVAGRRGTEPLMMAIEAAKRSRWLDSQPIGGRRGAIDRLIAADPAGLPPADAARRAALLARHPDLARAVDESTIVRTRLAAAMLAAVAQPGQGRLPGEAADWSAYRQISTRQSQFVSKLAVERDPTVIAFPPLSSVQEIRTRLRPRQLMLSFHWTSGGLLASLESHERIATWQIRQPGLIAKEMATLAKELCLFDPVAPVGSDKLAAADWRVPAEQIERTLFEGSKVTLAEGIDELIIVPDGMLWYLPFELLPVGSAREADEDRRLLRECCRVRYAPTRSLAVIPSPSAKASELVGVVAGRLPKGEKPDAMHETVERLAIGLGRGVPISPAAGRGGYGFGSSAPAAASLVDGLVVLDELSGEGPAAGRIFIASGGPKEGLTFGGWLEPPRKQPLCIALPGFQSAVAGGLARLPARPGDELFQTATDLVAANASTVLLSRWRVGGATTLSLVEEFMRDAMRSIASEGAGVPPSESWRRAVDLVTREPPDPAVEPRLRPSGNVVLEDASHPFFWSGYMLIDCGTRPP